MRVYIGYDSSNYGQMMAYSVCRRSIRNYNSSVEIFPIKLEDLRKANIYNRINDTKQSTEFTYSRFLTPFLARYKGHALFCDSDFLWRCDVEEVLKFSDENNSVSCVKHEYVECPNKTKMDGKKQEWYPKKNWSSLMLFNSSHLHCKSITPQIVSKASPKYLHRMEWTEENLIGSIPLEYNFLVGYYSSKNPKALHFTDGGPWHKDTKDVSYGDEWLSYLTKTEKEEYEKGVMWNS